MKTSITLLWKFLLASSLVMVGTMLTGALVFAVLGNPWEGEPEAAAVFLPMAISSSLLVLALIAPAQSSALPRGQRVAAIFLACLGVNVLLMHVEAAAFLDMTLLQFSAALLQSALNAGWLSLVAGLLFGTREGQPGPAESIDWRRSSGRIAIAAVAYVALYLGAGMLIYPKVADYYASQGFEAGPWILPLAFLRGGLYVVFSMWLVRSMRCTRLQCALAVGVMFPILAGVAALIMPSGVMPDHVRFWHAIEIGASNFVFGFLVGWLFSPAGSAAGDDAIAGRSFA